MAYHRKHHRHHRHHRRHNPFGVSGGVVKDAVYVAVGALGASALPGFVAPSFASGWPGVAATALSAVAISFGAKMVGGPAGAAEALKGGLAAAVIKALNAAGFTKSLGLGLYSPSWFAVPTSSDAYGRTFAGNVSAAPALPAAAGVHGLGYHRFRSRYGGNYGGM